MKKLIIGLLFLLTLCFTNISAQEDMPPNPFLDEPPFPPNPFLNMPPDCPPGFVCATMPFEVIPASIPGEITNIRMITEV